MMPQQLQPAACLHTDFDYLTSKKENYSDLYRAGMRHTVPQVVIQLLPETIPLGTEDVASISKESPQLRSLLDDSTPLVLEVKMNQHGVERMHKVLRSRMPLPERAVIASAAVFLAIILLPIMVFSQFWDGVALCGLVFVIGMVVRRMSINHAVAGVDVDGEFYPTEGLSGVSHPSFGRIMEELAELAKLQDVAMLDHPFLDDLQSIAAFVGDTDSEGLSSRERTALAEEATQLIDAMRTRITEEVSAINEIRKSTKRDLDDLGINPTRALLAEGDRQIDDIKVAGIRDRAHILRKTIEKDRSL